MHFLRKKDVDSNFKMSFSTSNPQTLAFEQRSSKIPIIESVNAPARMNSWICHNLPAS
jgi:hypothetical protein